MLFHVLHLMFTSCHGIATSCPTAPCFAIGPYVRRGSRVVRLLLEHQSDFQVLDIFKLPREKGVIIAIKQLRYTILTAVSLYIGRNTQFHIPNAFASLFHG